MSYDNWKRRLEIVTTLSTVALRRAALTTAGLTNMVPTEADEGYYRKPTTEKRDGKTVIIGYTAVALFLDQNTLVCIVGSGQEQREVTEDVRDDLWTWISTNPVTWEDWKRIDDGGQWQDLKTVGELYAEASGHPQGVQAPELTEDELYAKRIGAEIEKLPMQVATTTDAEFTLGVSNKIRDLRLAVEKLAAARTAPLKLAYDTERNKWAPLVVTAKAAETAASKIILVFRDKERRRLAAEQEAAAKVQRETDEANERIAQRAIARNEPEPPPVVVEVAAPAPLAPLVPAQGTRKLKEEEKWFLDEIEDYDKVFAYFRNTEQVRLVLKTLATAAVRAGHTIPGTKTHFGLI